MTRHGGVSEGCGWPQLSERMKRKVAATEGDNKAMRFAELYRRFSQKRAISKRCAPNRQLSRTTSRPGSSILISLRLAGLEIGQHRGGVGLKRRKHRFWRGGGTSGFVFGSKCW